jgi:hypothetical protein
VVDQRTGVGSRNVWAVIRSSAEKRLGKPLLMAYLFIALFSLLVVGGSLVVMRMRPR